MYDNLREPRIQTSRPHPLRHPTLSLSNCRPPTHATETELAPRSAGATTTRLFVPDPLTQGDTGLPFLKLVMNLLVEQTYFARNASFIYQQTRGHGYERRVVRRSSTSAPLQIEGAEISLDVPRVYKGARCAILDKGF